jgi:signal transduction histidine kinase
MRYFATYLIYLAVIARAIGWNQETSPIPPTVWILLAIYGVILFSERALTRRFPGYPRLYIIVQSALAIAMLYSAPTVDFLTMLFMPLSFQAVQFFPGRIGFIWIAVYSLAMCGMLLFGMEWEAGLTMVLAGSGANVLMGSFAHLIARTDQRQQENQRLFGDLQEAYGRLKDSATQAEALAAATERHRLVRELHDSLTQTLFSMNLAVQSAQLSIEESPGQAEEHLIRLQTLACSAAGEVQALTGQTPYRSLAQEGLAAALQRLAQERLAQDGLQVTIEVTGQRTLPTPVEANLYRITQEALNNVTRHAGVNQARVRLCLESPAASLEIEDAGCGFDMSGPKHVDGFGLAGMAERASEIGWGLEIKSRPGQGTHIRVEETVL